MRKSRGSASSAGRESLRLELERGADVDRLAVATVVLQRGDPIALDIVADAPAHGDPLRERIGTTDIDRIFVTLPKRRQRLSVGTIRADGNASGKLVQRIADAHDCALTAADRGIR